MIPSRVPRALLRALPSTGLLLACRGDGPAAASPDAAPVGPESLTVTLVREPATVVGGAAVRVTAAVVNRSRHAVRAELRCPAAGLTLRVLAADGTLVQSAPVACRPEIVDGRVQTFAPGDSAGLQASFGIGLPGTYRVRAAYEATTGSSPVVELPLVVLAP